MPVSRVIEYAGESVDLSGRCFHSTVVANSPSAAAETIIASVTITGDASMQKAVYLDGWAAYTVGGSGTAVQFRIRRTDVVGTAMVASGALTRAAAALHADDIAGVDTAPTLPNQVYVMTMIVTAGATPSTVSAVMLRAIVV